MSESQQLKRVIVVGAGVVGLTTALKIQEHGGYAVTILAEVLPTDPKTIKYTSQWAGAQHGANTKDVIKRHLEKETFDIMWEISAPGAAAENCFMRIKEINYYPGNWSDEIDDPKEFSSYPDFKFLEKEELPSGVARGISFTTLTIDPPAYLKYLLSRFLAKGGVIIRGIVQHISQVVEGAFTEDAGRPAAVVVCTGLGARFLGGIEDKDMYPIRGQTLFVRAPWVNEMLVRFYDDGWVSYIIPRKSGLVVVGGVMGANDWYPKPRPETREKILEHAFDLYPELVSPEIRKKRTATKEDVDIVEDGCGLRPARKGGIRLEVDSYKGVPLVFNYGHGGYGFQSSWGSATIALKLLDGAMKKREA
ncbi:hypothetical protein C8J56DRAFT_1055227 [Mycena floridula]|nr:hypothetical protein C8J56DRAFT_1055227 [Mycena floridula]